MTSPRIGLFGLTGFGNAVLRAICRNGHKPEFIVTRRETAPFPYYQENDLPAEAAGLGVRCLFGSEGETHAINEQPDIILVATYHRILSQSVREAADIALNFHPSLLPRYRGPNPFFWVLRNGEVRTGLTVHGLVAAIDAGEIFWQRSLEIDQNETQGSLRGRLANLAGIAALETISLFKAGELKSTPQVASEISYFGKPSDMNRTLDTTMGMAETLRVVRATLPYPGAILGNRLLKGILGCWTGPHAAKELDVEDSDDKCLLRLRDGAILFSASPAAHLDHPSGTCERV